MPESQPADLSHITPEQFAALVAAASDELILQTVRETGVEPTLSRIFEGMRERFRPEKAQGVDARIQFVVKDEGEEHPYLVAIREGSCTVDRERIEDAKVTLTSDVLSFVKLTAGKAGGPQLFMTGKLKISGDLMFATRIMDFFEVPKPG